MLVFVTRAVIVVYNQFVPSVNATAFPIARPLVFVRLTDVDELVKVLLVSVVLSASQSARPVTVPQLPVLVGKVTALAVADESFAGAVQFPVEQVMETLPYPVPVATS